MPIDIAQDRRLRLFVFLLLLASYLLIYIPTPDSADGDAILAVSSALVRSGSADISILGAQDAQFEHDMSRMGVFGADGALYSKKGLAPSLALLPLTLAAQIAPWLPLRASAMLFNPLVTALAGALLYTLARELGYRPRTALWTALLYGWATTAAVYTKTLFGEPLAALLIVVAVLGVVRWRCDGRARSLVLVGVMMGIAIGINMTYLIATAIVGSFILALHIVPAVRPGDAPDKRALFRTGAAFAIPIMIALGLIALYNLARFGSPFTSGYYFGEGEGFNRPFLVGIFGLTLSPYRGLLWYAPIVLFSLPGAWLLLQKKPTAVSHPPVVLLLFALIAAQFAVYASWWSWHGGVVWGPRFILPVLPLIMLCAVPIIERGFSNNALRMIVIALAILSVGVQIPGILLSPYPSYGVLSGTYGTGDMNAVVATLRDDVLTATSANAIVGHIELLMKGGTLDPAWLRGEPLIVLCALALAGAAVWFLRSRSARAPLVSLLVCFATLNIVASSQLDSPDVEAARRLEAMLDVDAPVLVASNHYGSALLDVETRRILSIAAPTAPDDPLAAPMWRHARGLESQLWYLTWFPPANDANWTERALWQDAAFAQEQSIDGHRALLFSFVSPAAVAPGGWRFGDIELTHYGISLAEQGLHVTLDWAARSEQQGDYTWFAHLLDAHGEIIAQQDRPPQGGYRPASSWQPGEVVHDRLYFPNARGSTALRIGWVDPTSQERLPVFNADGTRQSDDYVLIPISGE